MDLRLVIGGILVALVDLATGVQLILAAVALAVAIAVGDRKRKDATIHDLEQANAAKRERLEELKEELFGTSVRADDEHERRRELERDVSSWEARYETLERFAAPQAFDAMVERLTAIDATIGVAISAQGELIQKNTELQARAIQALEQIGKDLEKLTQRIEHLSAPATR